MVDLESVLRERFGLESFRPWQREAIDALLEGPGRVLVVAPTGGGKSLTYQLPATVLEGTTLVLSPLVALMEDQVRALEARGVPATFLASTLEPELRRHRESSMLRGRYKIVYAAPERLASDAFVENLLRCNVQLVAVDEAHCIAQWGHDFRPDYLRIGALLARLRPPRVLACTATATPQVRGEIRQQLRLGDACREVLRGFARPNLHLAAHNVEGASEARREVLAALSSALGAAKSPRGASIVYAATRRQTEQWAALLREQGWNAASYHAGMPGSERSDVASRFAERALDVIVATNAFGMGIDRPDIRAVLHVQPPSSIEAYYQEVGRAGRDGAEAWGLLLCSGADIALRRRLVTTGSDGGPAPAEVAARAWALFRELLRYLDARTCRHDFILRYFGDERELLGGCGHCDICVAMDSRDEDAGLASPAAADAEHTARTVRIALSAVARARQRAGMVAIAEMVRGVDGERTRRFGFTELSTFGLLRERTHPWTMDLLRALLAAGWIESDSDRPPRSLRDAGRRRGDARPGTGAVRLARRARHAAHPQEDPCSGERTGPTRVGRSARARVARPGCPHPVRAPAHSPGERGAVARRSRVRRGARPNAPRDGGSRAAIPRRAARCVRHGAGTRRAIRGRLLAGHAARRGALTPSA